MSAFTDQFIARYGTVKNLKKSTKEFKDMDKSRNEDIKRKVKEMLGK